MTREKPQAPEPTANYPAHQHEDMKRQVEEKFDPGLAGEIADEWKAIGSTLTELAVDFQVIVTGSEAGWTGSAAEGARAALAKVGKFSDMTGDHFTATGSALHTQTSAASEAKTRMPEPVEYDPKKMLTDAIGSGSIFNLAALPVTMPMQKAKSEGAKAEAVQVMQSRDDAMRSATTSMPAFAEMPTVTQDQGTATSTTQTSSVNTNTVNPNTRFGTTGMPGTGNTDTSGTTNTSWVAPPTVTPPPVAPPVNLPPSGPPAPPITPPWAMPPGTRPPGGKPPVPPGRPVPPPGGGRPLPPGARPPGGGLPGRGPGGGPGGTGGAGGAGGGRPGGVPGGPGGMGGRGAAGGFGPLGAGNQAGFGPAGASGQPGASGRGAAGTPGAMGGMGAGGQGGQGDEDQEHKAKYLIPTDDYFDDDRLVAPPTIGE
ncbi:hypothetical protein ALI22I_00395 [Saccharothrix sp. ALI-22-I]|uniref:hypothetical protein n=1 Tax=Saccharothrix sp. ALI-22-I TaxID=1933778 RepID=UPI00097C9161|nr:hypothetical protein [Saccharothrix sp. ALI-22-I]ONI93041.1 hypothetical protein ALI22I_00395 [Saccharothrix sp. ALI-22-I]